MKIGVLALQGAFAEHCAMLGALGAQTFEIRQAGDLDRGMDGLVIPGGESTVMGKLMRELGMADRLRSMILGGLPTFGTCAGLILLAEKLADDETVHLGTMDITAKRNAYGRQLGSFHAEEEFGALGRIPMTFIRAPYIERCGEKAEPLAVCGGKTVAARQGDQLVTAFHPELTSSTAVHSFFLNELCRG